MCLNDQWSLLRIYCFFSEMSNGAISFCSSRWKGILEVLCKFCRCWSKWPLAVAGVSSRYLLTFSNVNPGQPMRWLLRMACHNVDFDGLPSVACKYCMRILVDWFFGVITFNDWFCLYIAGRIWLRFCWGKGMSQSPSDLFLNPWRIKSKFLNAC